MSAQFETHRDKQGHPVLVVTHGNESRGRGYAYRKQYDRDHSSGNRYRGDRSTEYFRRPSGYGSFRGRYNDRNAQATENHQPGSYADRVRPDNQRPEVNKKEPDLQHLLQQISNTLVVLSGRVESLEKKKGPDSNTAPAARATEPAKPAGPFLHKSNNKDFVSVSKSLYRMVQIGHHTSNWKRLPKSIDERLTKLVDDINPPMCDSDFKKELNIITQQYGEEVRRLVSDHLDRKLVEAEQEAKLLDPTDVGRAKEVASKYLTARLGKRLADQRRVELLNSAASVIGAQRGPQPAAAATGTANAGWTEVKNRTPTRAADTHAHDSRKRKADSANSTPIENRFEVLKNEEMVVAIDDDDVEPDSPRVRQARPRHTPKKQRQCVDNDIITEQKVRVFSGDKEDWEVIPESPEISVIVVGDSNLRKVRLIPQYWQVNALPGAQLGDFTGGLTKLAGQNKQFCIVLQAGMNSRSKFDTDTEADITSMLFAARRNPSIGEVFFSGVSIPPGMPEADAQRIEALNQFMKSELGEGYYIEPLDREEVAVEINDRWKIHYNQETIDKISRKIIHRITGSDFQSV
jgi:hypothetical protein